MNNEEETERIGKFLPEFFTFENKLKTNRLKRLYAVESMHSGKYLIITKNQTIEYDKSIYFDIEQFSKILESLKL